MSSDLKKDLLVDSFLSTLRLEKGLSENTIKAYSNDCQAFNKWLFIKKRYAAKDSSEADICLLYTSPSPRDKRQSRMPSSA